MPNKRAPCPTGLQGMREAIQDEKQVSEVGLLSLMDSIPEWIEAIITGEGDTW